MNRLSEVLIVLLGTIGILYWREKKKKKEALDQVEKEKLAKIVGVYTGRLAEQEKHTKKAKEKYEKAIKDYNDSINNNNK